MKALKEGRTPTPGGYGEEEAEEDKKEAGEGDDTIKVETVEEEDDIIPAAPGSLPPMPMEPPTVTEETEEENAEEGTEVPFSALQPPDYPGETSPAATPNETPEPFVAPPSPPPSAPLPPPPPQSAAIPPPPYEPPKPKAKGGLFGFGRSGKNAGVSKAQMQDAVELTKFALAALEDKDADLAASRLQQALKSLGR